MNSLLRRSTLIVFIINWFTLLNSQEVTTKEFIRSVQTADLVYLYDKDYERAAGLYKALLNAHPGNANLAAKLGFCYLNIDEKKQDALKLLEQASKNIAIEQEYVFYGEKAPADTYFYLAAAYHMNDSLKKAISIYNDYRKTLGKFDAPQAEYIDIQIGACYYAMEMKKKPLTILSELFAPWLKDYPGACNPVLSKNDSVFIFTQKTAAKTRILCSFKTNGQWDLPSDITGQLGGYDRFYSNSITGDGKLLIIFLDDGADGNLYFCQREDTLWTKIKNPGKPLNTIYWESFGFITPDGKTLFLASNRPGGMGELDIWVSDKLSNGTWGDPVNCGDVINTPENEDTPFYDPTNNALIFSSKGYITMGGYDVFRSTKMGDTWTKPVGMPYAFNTTTDNTSFILNNNTPGFVASRFDTKSQSKNIYSIVAIDPVDEITVAEGKVILKDGMSVNPEKASVKVTNLKKKTTPQVTGVNPDGSFKLEIKPGDYQVLVSHAGYQTDTVLLNIPLYFQSHKIVLNPELTPEQVVTGTFLTIKNVLFDFDSYALDDQAKSGLEAIKPIVFSYPDLKMEVAGYTDPKGSAAYNLKLADNRAQSVIDYLSSTGIPASSFVKKAFGESNFAAINTNSDGSDNPEGRKYNRRVTFGIVDPHSGIVIRQESFTPEHLRLISSIKYSVVLKKSNEKLLPGYFNNLMLNGLMFIRTLPTDAGFVYSIGVFYSKQDADKYLAYAKEKGFQDAYIVDYYELNK